MANSVAKKDGKDAYILINNKENFLGRGGFGLVFKGTRKFDERKVAIKVSKEVLEFLDERDKQSLKDEVRLMKENPHPFIVTIIDDFVDSGGHLCIV
jgi:serine/threonine protein kinase